MKEPSATSPFAAKTSQEQRHQWTIWQAQQDYTRPVENRPENKETEVGSAPLSAAPLPPKTPVKADQSPITPPHRSQYHAVIQRMRAAGKQAGTFTSVSSTAAPSGAQTASGQEKG